MVIRENFNLINKRYCKIGYSYELPLGFIKNSEEAKSYMARGEFFKTTEIEVFQVFN
jgi:hypothetical protein